MSTRSRDFTLAGATAAGLIINVASRLRSFPAYDSLAVHTVAVSMILVLAILGVGLAVTVRNWAAVVLLMASIPMQVLKIGLAYRGHPYDLNHDNVDLAIAYAADIVLVWMPATILTLVWAAVRARRTTEST